MRLNIAISILMISFFGGIPFAKASHSGTYCAVQGGGIWQEITLTETTPGVFDIKVRNSGSIVILNGQREVSEELKSWRCFFSQRDPVIFNCLGNHSNGNTGALSLQWVEKTGLRFDSHTEETEKYYIAVLSNGVYVRDNVEFKLLDCKAPPQ